MKKVLSSLVLIQISLAGFPQIIADHTVVDRYMDIPEYYINEVKKMFVSYAGESHSEALRRGLELLEASFPAFQVNIDEYSEPSPYTTAYLRFSANTWGDLNNEAGWIRWYGEEDWYTSSQAIERTKTGITYCHDNGLEMAAFGFGHCYYDGGGNYISATQQYIDYCAVNGYNTKVFFTTGPNDSPYEPDKDYERYQAIRAYVAADPTLILFDFADIICYNNDGSGPNTILHDGSYYPFITDESLIPNVDGFHMSNAAAVRLARAMWWMLARIAGWDGYPVCTWQGGVPGYETDWNTAGNWSGGEVPSRDINVIIPAGRYFPVISTTTQADCHNLEIQAGATLTIESDGSGTGSLIVTGNSTGNVTCNRQLRTETNNGDYHYFSSPVASNSEANSTRVSTAWEWNEVTGVWTTLAMTALQNGRGYNLDQTAESDGLISFTGPLVTSGFSIDATSPYSDITDGTEADYIAGRDIADGSGHSGTARSADYPGYGGGGWNMLGNPYTSAINAMTFINYRRNLDNLEPSYQAVFLYDGNSPGHARYYYIGNPTGWEDDILLGQTYIQVGQGFFVLAMNDTSVFTFTRAMQEHSTGAIYLKSSQEKERWPGLKLKVTSGSDENSTTIVFRKGMTAGLDPGYDVGMMGFGSGAGIYTALVEDNGISFARQALPEEGIDNLVVPVGIDFKNGGEVTIAADIKPLRGFRYILEDRSAGIFTDLGTDSYSVTLPGGTNGPGRFFVHIVVDRGRRHQSDSLNLPDLRIWAGRDNRVHIQGAVSSRALCQVYDIRGHKVLETPFSDTDYNTFKISQVVSGVYLVKVTDGEKVRTEKVFFR